MATVLILSLLASLITVSHGSVSMSATATTVKPGQSVRISCTVPDFKSGELVELYKYVDGTRDHDVKLSTNGKLTNIGANQLPFPGANRYNSSFIQEDNTTYIFYIDIADIEPQDGGMFTCRHLMIGQASSGRLQINVIVIPKMHLTYRNGTKVVHAHDLSKTKQEVTFREGEKAHFECAALEAFPGPIVTVSIGRIDITNQFLFNNTESDGGSGTPGFIPKYHSVVGTVKGLVMKKEYANDQMFCQAQNEGMAKPVVETITLRIKGIKSPGSHGCSIVPQLGGMLCLLSVTLLGY